MGIGGHILGPRKLRRLSRLTGLALERAYIRNGDAEGIVARGSWHQHVGIDPYSGAWWIRNGRGHWSTCDQYLTPEWGTNIGKWPGACSRFTSSGEPGSLRYCTTCRKDWTCHPDPASQA